MIAIPIHIGAGLGQLSDETRLEVCRELSAYWYRSGATHLDQALAGYEREVRARMEKEGVVAT